MEFIRSLRMKHRKVVKMPEDIKKKQSTMRLQKQAEEIEIEGADEEALRQPKKQKIQI